MSIQMRENKADKSRRELILRGRRLRLRGREVKELGPIRGNIFRIGFKGGDVGELSTLGRIKRRHENNYKNPKGAQV